MNIAVVILNWNGATLLETYLPSVVAYSSEAHIYVADNASTDNSISFLKEHYPSITIIQNTSNGGYAKGYNDALKQVKEPLYCLLNSDVEVTPNWLAPMQSLFVEHPEIGIAQPKIKDAKNRDYFEYAGAAGGFLDRFGYPFCRGRIFQALEKDSGQYNDITQIFWATGACMFIRKSVFEAVDGFDEDYFAHQEEIDLCWRAQHLGHQVFYNGFSEVYHLGGSTLSNMNPKKTFLNFRNSLFTVLKNTRPKQAFILIFARLILDGIAGLRFVGQLKPGHCIAILKAHISFYKHLGRMYRKRNKNFKNVHYFTTHSIVWSHFVNHRKKFNFLVKN